MEQNKKETRLEELHLIKKGIVKNYIVLVIFMILFGIITVIYSNYFMIGFLGFAIGFFREAFQLDNINRDIEIVKLTK